VRWDLNRGMSKSKSRAGTQIYSRTTDGKLGASQREREQGKRCGNTETGMLREGGTDPALPHREEKKQTQDWKEHKGIND